MRSRWPWMSITVLLVGLCAAPSAFADDEDDAPEPPPKHVSGHGIFNKMYDAVANLSQPKAPPPRPPSKNAKGAATGTITIINASHVDRAQADAAYFRRLAVCDHLREIAAAKNDAELERKAEELSEKSWQVYTKQLAQSTAQATKQAAKPAQKPTKNGKPAAFASADKTGNSHAPANGDVR